MQILDQRRFLKPLMQFIILSSAMSTKKEDFQYNYSFYNYSMAKISMKTKLDPKIVALNDKKLDFDNRWNKF